MATKYNFAAESARDVEPEATTYNTPGPELRATINPGAHDTKDIPNTEPKIEPPRVLFCNLMNSRQVKQAAYSLSSCRAAFSTGLVRTGTGTGTYMLMRLRRASDNSEVDLYQGVDDYYVDKDSIFKLSDWLGASSATVSTWYDQSGAGRHATQTIASVQPSLKVTNKRLALDFRVDRYMNLPDGTIPVGNAPYTVSCRHGVIDSTGGVALGGGTIASRRALLLRRNATSYQSGWWAPDHNYATYADNQSFGETYDGATRIGYVNGVAVSSTNTGVHDMTAVENRIGCRPGLASFLNGDLFELSVYSDALSATDMSALQYGPLIGAQASYGAIYTNPWYYGPIANVRRSTDSVTSDVYMDVMGLYFTDVSRSTALATWATGSTLYIPTLYDQSGSSRHATQVTPASQPILDYINRMIDFKPTAFMNMPDATAPMGDAPYTFYFRHGTINNASGGFMMAGNIALDNQVISFRRALAGGYDLHWRGNPGDLAWGSYSPMQSVAQTYDQSSRSCYLNGTLLRTIPSTGKNTQSTGNRLAWSTNSASDLLNGELQSVYIIGRALTDGDMSSLEFYASRYLSTASEARTFTTYNTPELRSLKIGSTARLTRGSDVSIRGLDNMLTLQEHAVDDARNITPCVLTVTNTDFDELVVTTASTKHNALLIVEPGAQI